MIQQLCVVLVCLLHGIHSWNKRPQFTKAKNYNEQIKIIYTRTDKDPSGHTVYGVGLQLLTFWDCRFKSCF